MFSVLSVIGILIYFGLIILYPLINEKFFGVFCDLGELSEKQKKKLEKAKKNDAKVDDDNNLKKV